MSKWIDSVNDQTPKTLVVNGDKPDPIVSKYNGKVKGSEILKGKFKLCSGVWIEMDLSLLEGVDIDPDQYYSVTAGY